MGSQEQKCSKIPFGYNNCLQLQSVHNSEHLRPFRQVGSNISNSIHGYPAYHVMSCDDCDNIH
eukprot:8797072-Karenia_brevis.AAC.1